MEVYLIWVMGLRFAVDVLLLTGTDRLLGCGGSLWRRAAGAALTAVCSGLSMTARFRFLGGFPWGLLLPAAGGAVAFGWKGVKPTGLYLLLSMALGGLAVSFGRNAWPSLILAGCGLWLLCRAVFSGEVYVPLELYWQGRRLELTALRDTGNTLRDPITGEQVLVLSPEAAFDLTGLTEEQLRRPLDTLASRPVPGLRLIPYHAVGSGGFLLGLRLEHVRIGGRRCSVVTAFAPEGLGNGKTYQALAGGAL